MSVVQRVHDEAARVGVPDMVRQLQELLGQRTIAFAANVRSSKSVGHWAQGTRPAPEALERLSALYQTVLVLKDETVDTKRAWLLGSNPGLDEQSPVETIRDGHGRAAVRAAEAFIGAQPAQRRIAH